MSEKNDLENSASEILEPELCSEFDDVQSEHESECESEPEPDPTIYKEDDLEELYENASQSWKKYGRNPEDFDWYCLVEEIEELSADVKSKDSWHYSFYMLIIKRMIRIGKKYWIADIFNKQELASEISKYFEKRGKVIITPSKSYRMLDVEPQKEASTIDVKEYERAIYDDIESDGEICSDDDEWDSGLIKKVNK